MALTLKQLALISLLAPFLGSLVAGLLGKRVGRVGAHWVTILLMFVSFLAALDIAQLVLLHHQTFNGIVYTWAQSGSFQFNIGFQIDQLTAYMMVVVTFVSLLVHIYSIGYMADDSGYQRFFSYMSLFTFSMLLLVTANNFLQLFIGWEGVGLVSYLLIGFWFLKPSAASGGFKAFIVNRVGDFGFILAIAAILDNFSTLNYNAVFLQAHTFANATVSLWPGTHSHLITVICILLFIGAMGKSAQIPLHVWLPESMEGPTPISALIHAATMVTAGVYLVARMSPLFDLSLPALSTVLIVGATGALFLGLLAFVETDIKRVIAYSTMSQLGYMMAANGVTAYSAGIFHLGTHACFKALLFLSAGSVIIALHHEQDLRKMGGLAKRIPLTYLCFLIGALALAAIPPFSGFYSKDAIIDAVHLSNIPGAHYAYICLILGAFVTAYYIFRAFFMAFHGKPRFRDDPKHPVKEHAIMVIPLILLAIPSVIMGFTLVYPMLYRTPDLLGHSVTISTAHHVMGILASQYHDAINAMIEAFRHPTVWLSLSGLVLAWLNVRVMPQLPQWFEQKFKLGYWVLKKQYGFDAFNQHVIVRTTRGLSEFFFRFADLKFLDGFLVDGSGRRMTWVARMIRRLQSGYLYHYVFIMILGLLAFLVGMIFF